MADESTPKFQFRYEYPEDYRPMVVNGAHGGVTPRGDIVMNLFYEQPGLPRVIEHELQPDGRLGGMIVPEDQRSPHFDRHVACGVVMNLRSAVELRDWLSRQIDQLKGKQATIPGEHEVKQ